MVYLQDRNINYQLHQGVHELFPNCTMPFLFSLPWNRSGKKNFKVNGIVLFSYKMGLDVRDFFFWRGRGGGGGGGRGEEKPLFIAEFHMICLRYLGWKPYWYPIYLAIRLGFPVPRMATNNFYQLLMKLC